MTDYNQNPVIVSKRIADATLKRFITHNEKSLLSQFLISIMLDKPMLFPILAENTEFYDLLTEQNLDQRLIEWLVSYEYNSTKDVAKRIAEHNSGLISQLTQKFHADGISR